MLRVLTDSALSECAVKVRVHDVEIVCLIQDSSLSQSLRRRSLELPMIRPESHSLE